MRATLTMQRIFIWAAACSLPALVRAEWLAQWNSEIWYVHDQGAKRIDTWRFTLGSLEDAVDTRREFPEESHHLVHYPSNCLVTMTLLNAVLMSLGLLVFPYRAASVAAARHSYLLREIAAEWKESTASGSLHQQVALIEVTFVVSLLLTTIISSTQLVPWCKRERGRVRYKIKALSFFSAKLLLGIPLVYFAVLALSSLFVMTRETTPLQMDALIAGYLVFLRWTRLDQNRRCPTCLQRLSSPVHVGRRSWALLDWNLHEYICPEGHGVMQIPTAPLMGQSTQEWVPLA